MIWGYFITALAGLVGVYVGHFFTSRRDNLKRKKEMRIEYLIEAYRKLEKGAAPESRGYSPGEFESAIADIQLLGSRDQVSLAFEFCEAASEGDGSLLQKLLENIRAELRSELKIDEDGLPSVRPFRIVNSDEH